ncbi:hypothetical protein Trydic_g18352 [Trypoxylus dichotomus]
MIDDDDVAVAAEHTDDDIVEDYMTASADRNDSEDKADQPSAALSTEEELFPKKQEAANAPETTHRDIWRRKDYYSKHQMFTNEELQDIVKYPSEESWDEDESQQEPPSWTLEEFCGIF